MEIRNVSRQQEIQSAGEARAKSVGMPTWRAMLAILLLIVCVFLTVGTIPSSASEYYKLNFEDGRGVSVFIETPIQTVREISSGKLLVQLAGNTDPSGRPLVRVSAEISVQSITECAAFVNTLKDSSTQATQVTDTYISPLECSVKTVIDALGFINASWIWSIDCKCYIIISVAGEVDAEDLYPYFAESLVRSVRSSLINGLSDDVLRNQLSWWSSWRSAKILPVSISDFDTAKANLSELIGRNAELVAKFPKSVDRKNALIETRRLAIEAEAARAEYMKRQEAAHEAEHARRKPLERDGSALMSTKLKTPEAVPSDDSGSQERVQPVTRPPDPNGLTFKMTNSTEKTLLVRFFNLGFSNKGPPKGYWPTSKEAYVLHKSRTNEYHLSCKKGEQICFGAHAQGEKYINTHHVYWGAALDADKGCTTCCSFCGSLRTPDDLVMGIVPPPPARVSRVPEQPSKSNEGSELVNGLGLAIGVIGAIGGVRNQTPTYNYSPAPPPRGPNQRQSGISGFR